ncbi:MAG: type II secretion system protein [Patescibacteria group bacterium]
MKSGAGFTLIEVIIAMAVFSVAMVLATATFVSFVQSQRRTITQQEMQNDARSAIEEIAQVLREGVVDYAYYSTNFTEPIEKTILFDSLDGTGKKCLAIRSALNEYYYYKLDGGVIKKYFSASPISTSCVGGTNWSVVTPENLTITNFTFLITPSQNPFQGKSYQACGTPGAPTACTEWGTYCNEDGSIDCAYQKGTSCYCVPKVYGDLIPLHPKVTFSLTVSRKANQTTLSETYQTTITSRVYKNFDLLNRYAP